MHSERPNICAVRRRIQKQPWLFVYLAVTLGVAVYLIEPISVEAAIWAGVAYALAMSLWYWIAQRRKAPHDDP